MQIKIHNVELDEVIEREMTAKELSDYQVAQSMAQTELETQAAKEAARQALLDKLGITADEAKLLLG